MQIFPSILNASFAALQQEIDSLRSADRLHLDVMDGQYVPSISFGPQMLSGCHFPLPIEVHLMTQSPLQQLDACLQAGAVRVYMHAEVLMTEARMLDALYQTEQSGAESGIVLDLQTSAEELSDAVLTRADAVLLMSVQAGAGGQVFDATALEKAQLLRQRGYTGQIVLDGGVTRHVLTTHDCRMVDGCVVGSALTSLSHSGRGQMIAELQKLYTC
ncbi:hypothetical protein H6771_00625 [Candidatus Peribacteria bacterium]|nr:hypothetical protein [Candidatus Peribacteria bacterium]